MNKKILIYAKQLGKRNGTFNISKINAKILSTELNADIIIDSNDRILTYDYDIILCTYFNRYTDYVTLKKLVKSIQKRFLLRTEYEPVVASAIKPYTEICNFEGGENYLNTNLLISRQPNGLTTKKYDCIYYSRYRADRMKYCAEYLQGEIYLSTHPKNHKHFYHAGCRPKTIKALDWKQGKETLNQFRYSLYMEDVYTHTVFNNLANRWYEAGFCNNVVFFDVNCLNTIMKSEIGHFESQIMDYVVSNYGELVEKIKHCNQDFQKHLSIQKTWRLSEPLLRQQMIEKLKQIIEA